MTPIAYLRLCVEQKAPAHLTAEAAAELLAGVERTWIPVAERLPEPMTEVLASCSGTSWLAWMQDGKWLTDDEYSGREIPVTHWMPLPRGPRLVAAPVAAPTSAQDDEGGGAA